MHLFMYRMRSSNNPRDVNSSQRRWDTCDRNDQITHAFLASTLRGFIKLAMCRNITHLYMLDYAKNHGYFKIVDS